MAEEDKQQIAFADHRGILLGSFVGDDETYIHVEDPVRFVRHQEKFALLPVVDRRLVAGAAPVTLRWKKSNLMSENIPLFEGVEGENVWSNYRSFIDGFDNPTPPLSEAGAPDDTKVIKLEDL